MTIVTERNVPAGVSSAADTVGLTGLVPLEVVTNPPVTLRGEPGNLQIWIDLPAGVRLEAGQPVLLRVYGGEAGLDFERNGQIIDVATQQLPIERRYQPRVYPSPPASGQLVVDCSFRFRWNDRVMIQDVQWRQPVSWEKRGATRVELRYVLVP
jgi:hypothetical protein